MIDETPVNDPPVTKATALLKISTELIAIPRDEPPPDFSVFAIAVIMTTMGALILGLAWRTVLAVRRQKLKVKELTETIKKQRKKKAEAVIRIHDMKGQIEEYEEKLEELEKSSASVQMENEKLQESVRDFVKKLEGMQEAMEALKREAEAGWKMDADAIKNFQEELGRILEMDKEDEELQKMLAQEELEWQEKEAKAREVLTALQGKIQKLRDKQEEADESFQEQICEREGKIKKSEELLFTILDENEKLKGLLAEKKAELDLIEKTQPLEVMEAKILAAEKERDEYKEKLLAEEDILPQLKKKLQALEREHAWLIREKSELDQEAKSLQQEVDSVNAMRQTAEEALQQILAREEAQAERQEREFRAYKERVDRIKDKHREKEALLKAQLAYHEMRAKENMASARASEKATEEAKREAEDLRKKLAEDTHKLYKLARFHGVSTTLDHTIDQTPPVGKDVCASASSSSLDELVSDTLSAVEEERRQYLERLATEQSRRQELEEQLRRLQESRDSRNREKCHLAEPLQQRKEEPRRKNFQQGGQRSGKRRQFIRK